MSTPNGPSLASYATSAILFVKGMLTSIADQFASMPLESKIGVCLGLGTFVINWYYQRRRDRREEARTRLAIQSQAHQRGYASKRLLPVIAAGAIIAAGVTHQVTQRQYDFTSGWEGVRTTTYLDPADGRTLTVCRGITNAAAPGWVIAGKTYTPEQCYDKEVELMQTVFAPAIARLIKVPTTQQQREMLADFAWNKGIPALASSTLLRKLNAGDCWGAADEFDRWIWAGGRRWASIGRRMNAQQDNFRKWCK